MRPHSPFFFNGKPGHRDPPSQNSIIFSFFFKPPLTDTSGLFQSYISHVCTKCCVDLTNISPIWHQKQGHIIWIWEKPENLDLDLPPHLKIVYFLKCGLLNCWHWVGSGGWVYGGCTLIFMPNQTLWKVELWLSLWINNELSSLVSKATSTLHTHGEV